MKTSTLKMKCSERGGPLPSLPTWLFDVHNRVSPHKAEDYANDTAGAFKKFLSCTIFHMHVSSVAIIWCLSLCDNQLGTMSRFNRRSRICMKISHTHNKCMCSHKEMVPEGRSHLKQLWSECPVTPFQWWDGTPLLPGDRLMKPHAEI